MLHNGKRRQFGSRCFFMTLRKTYSKKSVQQALPRTTRAGPPPTLPTKATGASQVLGRECESSARSRNALTLMPFLIGAE
jgi:hypothetical protein